MSSYSTSWSTVWRRSQAVAIPVLILMAALASSYILSKLREPPAAAEPTPVELEVETVVAAPYEDLQLEVEGYVVPYREVLLSAEIAGRIVTKSPDCRAGHYVEQGALLLEIDPRDYEIEVRRLTEEVAQNDLALQELREDIAGTEQLLELAQQELELTQSEVERQRNLASGGAVSSSTLDRARQAELTARNGLLKLQNQLRLQQSQVAGLEQALEAARTQLQKAELDLRRTKITAPVSGVIVEDPVEEGEFVTPGVTLVTLEDTSAVEVSCRLRMEELRWLWPNGAAVAASDGAAGNPDQTFRIPPTPVAVIYNLAGYSYTWEGMLSRYEGAGIDEQTRTVACRVVVDQPRGGRPVSDAPAMLQPPALVRGMFVSVRIYANVPHGSLLQLPEAAIRPGNRAWIVRHGKLEVAEVQVVRLVEHAPKSVESTPAPPTTTLIASAPQQLEFDGLAVPHREVTLAAEVAGVVMERSPQAETGGYVTEGTALMRLDPQNYQLQVQELTAGLQQAASALSELSTEEEGTQELIRLAEQEHQLQQRELQRQTNLLGRGASQNEIDAARRGELAARQSLRLLQNQLRALRLRRQRLQRAQALAAIRLEKAQLDLSRTTVTAPFDGVVVGEPVERGAYVQPGTTLVTLSATAALEVQCHLAVDDLVQLTHRARSAEIATTATPEQAYELPDIPVTIAYRLSGRTYLWDGSLIRREGIGIDPETRTVPCRVLVRQPRQWRLADGDARAAAPGPPALLRGMYVSVQLERPLLTNDRRRWQSASATPPEFVAIIDASSSDVAAGDHVVVTPLPKAESGLSVREQVQP